jgi:hypothetical protein
VRKTGGRNIALRDALYPVIPSASFTRYCVVLTLL